MAALPDTVLITGAAGWLGTNLLHALAAAQPSNGELRARCTRRTSARSVVSATIAYKARLARSWHASRVLCHTG